MKPRIENPRIEFQGESFEYASACACFEVGESRFRIWLDRETGKAQEDSPLYKNHRVTTPENRLARTKHLDPAAIVNRALLAELWESVDFAASCSAFAATCERKARERAAAGEKTQGRVMSGKRKHGDRESCGLCQQDIEWTGRGNGWRDRGGNRDCVAHIESGEVIQPKAGQRHKPRSPK